MAFSKRQLSSMVKDYLYVVFHGERQDKKGKQPSLSYAGEKNPQIALDLARIALDCSDDAEIMIKNDLPFETFELSWLIKDLPEVVILDISRELAAVCAGMEYFQYDNFHRLADVFASYFNWTNFGPLVAGSISQRTRAVICDNVYGCENWCYQYEEEPANAPFFYQDVKKYLNSISSDEDKFEAAIDFFSKKTTRKMRTILRRYYLTSSDKVQGIMKLALSKIYNSTFYKLSIKDFALFVEVGEWKKV